MLVCTYLLIMCAITPIKGDLNLGIFLMGELLGTYMYLNHHLLGGGGGR